jgi:hypothetical protein
LVFLFREEGRRTGGVQANIGGAMDRLIDIPHVLSEFNQRLGRFCRRGGRMRQDFRIVFIARPD